jgi:hypothetical protein
VRRTLSSLLVAVLALALLAPPALAGKLDGGEGVYGLTDDKVVTYAGFILVAAFPLLIAVLSAIQWRLDKRKDARKAAAKARAGRGEWSGGW